MARLPMTPSIGARITVKERSRSALACAVCNSCERARRPPAAARAARRHWRGRRRSRLARSARRRPPDRGWRCACSSVCWLANSLAASACWRANSDWVRVAAACAETSCARACATAACAAGICWPMRSTVACWVATLSRAASTREPVVAVVDAGDHVAGMHEACCRPRRSRRRSRRPWRRAWWRRRAHRRRRWRR